MYFDFLKNIVANCEVFLYTISSSIKLSFPESDTLGK